MAQTGKNWDDAEIAAIVESYFGMLRAELRGDHYVKLRENERLQSLTSRSHGSIEFEYQNISAALEARRLVSIDGYKPLMNRQSALDMAVETFLDHHPDILSLMDRFVSEKAAVPATDVVWGLHETAAPVVDFGLSVDRLRFPVRKDYVALEERNRSLGYAGELLVLDYERERLRRKNRHDLASRVEHVAQLKGDGLGFDIASFNATTGEERFIEVKTTRRGNRAPFYLSKNEVTFSSEEAPRFSLYRVYAFDRRPGLYKLHGSLEATCALDPQEFLALPHHAAS
ncbi:DUF3883 domain-containing protein [Tessaracoccus palaemonis]|uniref:DUF3883 domain-containing protein n=1 Tax=Tessaracoccus palaemonis TaxID=2829499 RepID=A0ABX8SHD4_9ACTN|nr:DUF3883 domain-containing protein [Tessaracoccus palaemonis]QXT62796.1 DUF3883 domain-containing protein [Tessaracoccus palaemonis]